MNDSVEEPSPEPQSLESDLAEAEAELLGEENPQYSSEEEEEKKKRRRRIAVIGGLGALILAAGLCKCTGVVDKVLPQPDPEKTAYVQETDIPPTATEEVPVEPTPTDEPAPIDVRDAWLGFYRGSASGRTTNWITQYTHEFDDSILWIEVVGLEECLKERWGHDSFCDEETQWGVDISFTYTNNIEPVAEVVVYLPEDLYEASNLTLEDDILMITPSKEHPFELVIQKKDDKIIGYLLLTGDYLEQWKDVESIPEIHEFEGSSATYRQNPFIVD